MRVDRHLRAARERRQLQLGELEHHAVLRRQLGQALDEGRADVAAEQGGRAARIEDRRGERAGRRLALRARDADRERRAEPKEEVDLADDGHATFGLERGRAPSRSRGSVVGKRLLTDGEVQTSACPASATAGRRPGPAAAARPARRARRSPPPSSPPLSHVVDGHRGAAVGRGSAPARCRCAPARAPPPAGRANESQVERLEVDRAPAVAIVAALTPACPRVADEEDHADHRGQHAHDPEAQRDLLLVPARQLEMVVQRASSGRRGLPTGLEAQRPG